MIKVAQGKQFDWKIVTGVVFKRDLKTLTYSESGGVSDKQEGAYSRSLKVMATG